MSRVSACPECGSEISLWASKFAWFSGGRVSCPSCRALLRYDWTPAISILSFVVFVLLWIGSSAVTTRLVPRGLGAAFLSAGLFAALFFLVSWATAFHLRSNVKLRARVVGASREDRA